MKTNTAILVLLAAVGLGLVGGILGGIIIGGDGVDRETADQVRALEARVEELEQLDPAGGPRVSFVDVEGLFMEVFRPQVEAERQARDEQREQLNRIQQRFAEGELGEEEAQDEFLIGQTRLLEAELDMSLSMVDKMLGSGGFDRYRAELESIGQQAREIRSVLGGFLEQARAGVLDRDAYATQLQQIRTTAQQIDQYLSQLAAEKIMEQSAELAREEGYDIALRKREVVVYADENTVIDVTGQIKPRLEALFE